MRSRSRSPPASPRPPHEAKLSRRTALPNPQLGNEGENDLMKPSLLSLFQRGRYHRLPPASDDDTEEVVSTRKEAERYAVAAIGFCLVHHARFRRFFIKVICDVTLSAQARCEVQVEPHHWADLEIHFGRRQVAVIEFKLGAPLQSHQNPSKDEFWTGGYGERLATAYPNHTKHFIVLGPSEWLDFTKHPGWHFRQLHWADLAKNFHRHFHRTPLLNDLRDCLSQFGVWDFASMKARELSVGSSAVRASAAWDILWTAFTSPDLKLSAARSSSRVDAVITRPDQWHFGIEVRAAASAPLKRVTRPVSGGAMLWFGWECERRDETWLSVWLYCESESLADAVEAEFRSGKRSSNRLVRSTDEQGHRTHIGIRGQTEYGVTELDWFVGTLGHFYGWALHVAPPTSTVRSRRVRS